MIIFTYLPLLAGIGMFLYGMSVLGKALEGLAGAKMEKTLEKLTDNPIKGVLLGTGVTAVIQSSSATTVMVIGLLNAGVFTLTNALPVIMGANVGTTVTGQLLRLGDISSSNFFLSLFKPSSFGPILIAIGACITMFSKKHSRKTWGNLMMGLGLLFFGMTTMEKTLSPLGQEEWFQSALVMFNNPLLGILLGAGLTTLLQSSSASIGVMQALSVTGLITWSNAIPLILGQNVGKCVNVLLATIGAPKDSKRAVLLHLLLNIIGMVVFAVVIYGANAIFHFTFWDQVVNRGSIADFHTMFSVITVLMLLPFSKQLVKLAMRIIPDDNTEEEDEAEIELARLDDNFIATPGIAIVQARRVVVQMGNTALQAFRLSRKLHESYDPELLERLQKLEGFLDRAENALNSYILKITPHRLTIAESNTCSEMLHSVTNFERIGDHCVNIQDIATFNYEHDITYSENGWMELNKIFDATDEILETALRTYVNNENNEARFIEAYTDVIEQLEERLKDRHIERLQLGLCNVQSGISFLNILANIDRISAHCSNIGKNLVQMDAKDTTHYAFHTKLETGPKYADSHEYQIQSVYFSSKYAIPEDVVFEQMIADAQRSAAAKTAEEEKLEEAKLIEDAKKAEKKALKEAEKKAVKEAEKKVAKEISKAKEDGMIIVPVPEKSDKKKHSGKDKKEKK